MMILAVGMTGLLAQLAVHLDAIESRVVEGYTLEAFLDIAADSLTVENTQTRLSELPYVEHVDFISKDEAAERFRKTMGVDLLGTLNENPLPASFRVSCNPSVSADALDSLAVVISSWSGCDEVVYPRKLIHLLGSIRNRVNSTGVAVVVGFALLTFALTAVIFRLSIHSETDKIKVMELLGASRAIVRVPFLLAGMILGAVGGIIAALALAALDAIVQSYFQFDVSQGWTSHLVMVIGGLAWGLLSAAVAVVWGVRSI
jgi:cell division transport system permease protein